MNADLHQWIVTDPHGAELLVTVWTAADREPAIEVAPRIHSSAWGPPCTVRPAP